MKGGCYLLTVLVHVTFLNYGVNILGKCFWQQLKQVREHHRNLMYIECSLGISSHLGC
jgi:hypothetical protein